MSTKHFLNLPNIDLKISDLCQRLLVTSSRPELDIQVF